jgi:DNA-binding MarR family transcriptional regulator
MTTEAAHAGADVERFFDDLVRCETRLYNATGDALRNEHGLTTVQFEFLRALRETPGMRVADLAVRFAIGVGASSKGIDRLEALGWVERVAHPDDRRSSLVRLTEAGERLTDAATATFRRALAGLVSEVVDQGALAAAGAALRTLRSSLEERRAGQPVG